MGADSAGKQLLQVFRRNKILILRMLANEVRDVRTQRYYAEMIVAREIKRKSGKLCGESVALVRLRHFGVVNHHAAGEAAVGEYGGKIVDIQLESVRFFVMCYGGVTQVYVHGFAHRTLRMPEQVYQGIRKLRGG
jgi:hypothetical protein